ncbi:GLD2 polymerase, partial [Trogon melanurus]|nr:GLD2 polymerase [Trogon melanurus]
MFPISSNLGHPPFPSKHQKQSNFFNKLPLNLPPTLVSHQQIIDAHGNLATVPAVTPQTTTCRNGSRVHTSEAPTPFRGRKRPREQSTPNVKRQRFHSHHSETTVVNQAVPLPEEHRYSFPGSIQSPLLHARYLPGFTGYVLPLQDHIETTLPVAKDKLSQQVLDIFHACQQQICDLNRKELCRTQLQKEIQQIFPQSRLFLVGSSLNGFGTRTSDADLCLVVKEEPVSNLKHIWLNKVNQKTEARHILSLVQTLFNTRLCNYIERTQLIRAKVPIVKFRDKVRQVFCFDLNVNNIVGIRNTFLLRTYAQIENRVRPLALVVKKWAHVHEINDASRGTLNSYSLMLMVLHYLQSEYFLLHVETVPFEESFDPTMQLHLVHQAPCTIPPYHSKNGSSLGDLLIGFFKYYATEFDWSHQMISVREAKAIPRPDGIEWRNKFICVEEPFDGTNTARAVHEKQKFDMIRGEFLQSWHLLRDKKDLNYILPLRAAIQKR